MHVLLAVLLEGSNEFEVHTGMQGLAEDDNT